MLYLPHQIIFTLAKYIYDSKDWPQFSWKDVEINAIFGEVRHLQGLVLGQMSTLGFAKKETINLETLTLDIVRSSEIEGEKLDYDQVRSSISRRLGLPVAALNLVSRNVEGVVEMMLDATQNYGNPITKNRLLGWHAALFPTGYSGMLKIEVGRYRSGEMQIVSGAMGKEKVHFEAVPANRVEKEMELFLNWLNEEQELDPVIKSAIAHFWFIIIHPFDDGNGRIARAISDLLLARADKSSERFYSMSSQILVERKKYYAILQRVQHNQGEITDWIIWFLGCLKTALLESISTLKNLLKKAEFWKIHEVTQLNERQRLMINKLFDGFDGKLKSSKWAKITKCSSDTALRDLKDLIEKGILRQDPKGGRSTHYELVEF